MNKKLVRELIENDLFEEAYAVMNEAPWYPSKSNQQPSEPEYPSGHKIELAGEESGDLKLYDVVSNYSPYHKFMVWAHSEDEVKTIMAEESLDPEAREDVTTIEDWLNTYTVDVEEFVPKIGIFSTKRIKG